MRAWKSVNRFGIVLFLGGLTLFSTASNAQAVRVKYADLRWVSSSWLLTADIEYRLTEPAKEALRNGIPLYWDVRIRIEEKRQFLWNETVSESQLRFRIQYHALLNMYRVRNENNGKVYNYSTLFAALDRISSIHDKVLSATFQLDPKRHYRAVMKVVFDREALPLPLRPVAYLDPNWYLSSNTYKWPLTN